MWFWAASSHVAAHLKFGRGQFSPEGLRPVTQALVGLLEDVRVEWLAGRELPGLRRIWLRFHQIAATSTPGFEELLLRLSRALLDPDYIDSHPWVAKGRALFFGDEAGTTPLAIESPEAIRVAASRLGNDIGQMRLQFNARLYRAAPSYRDDNSHLWLPDEKKADVVHELEAIRQGGGSRSGQANAAPVVEQFQYQEWDRTVPMVRPKWATVLDKVPEGTNVSADTRCPRVRCELPGLGRRGWVSRQLAGPELDVDALIEAQVSVRMGANRSAQVYRQRVRGRESGATLFLLDASASTGIPLGAAGTTALRRSQEALLSCVWALEKRAAKCAIHSFCSDGRHAIHYQRIKEFDERLNAENRARLWGVRSRLSTRMGAALRHATRLVLKQKREFSRVLLFTDGRPHDVDVFDSHYLAQDARHAVLEAWRRGVMIQCVCSDIKALGELKRIFGVGNVEGVAELTELPLAMERLRVGIG